MFSSTLSEVVQPDNKVVEFVVKRVLEPVGWSSLGKEEGGCTGILEDANLIWSFQDLDIAKVKKDLKINILKSPCCIFGVLLCVY